MSEFTELETHYQPICLPSGRGGDHESGYPSNLEGKIIRLEALARLPNSQSGELVFPKDLFAVSAIREASRLDRYIFLKVVKDLADWRHHGIACPVGVNIARLTLSDPDFPSFCAATLIKFRVPPSLICLEILEQDIFLNRLRMETLEKLRKIGMSLAVDDAGSGDSTRAIIEKIKPETVKIDQGLVRNLSEKDPLFKRLVNSPHRPIIIVEGIETSTHDTAVRNRLSSFRWTCGCAFMQGFGYGLPMPAQEVTQKLHKQRVKRLYTRSPSRSKAIRPSSGIYNLSNSGDNCRYG